MATGGEGEERGPGSGRDPSWDPAPSGGPGFCSRIKEIEVTGNSHYTKEQVIDLVLGGKMVQKLAFCYYENRFREHKSIPFIEEYKIEFKSPTKIEIVVFEKSVVGYVSYMSSYMYFEIGTASSWRALWSSFPAYRGSQDWVSAMTTW